MQLAVAMGDESSGGHLFSFSLCDPAQWSALVEWSLSSDSTHGFKH
jgi:hypothetical protein